MKNKPEESSTGRGRLIQSALRALDAMARLLPRSEAEHLETGRVGEEAAYFHLRGLGYTMVARNWRTVQRRGEVDLIGWDDDTLCFVEVKTRGARSAVPAELAVDRDKQSELRAMAKAYLQHMTPETKTRFDVVSVYLEEKRPDVTLIRNAFGWR